MKRHIKNTIMVLSLLILLSSNSSAYSKIKEMTNSCPCKPYPISNIFSRSIQKITGINFLAAKTAESQIKKELSKVIKGDSDITIHSYSATDLLAGKFKGMEFEAKDFSINDVYITSLEAKSLCKFIHLDYKHQPIIPLTPIFLSFKSVITEKDLNKTLSSTNFKDENAKISFKVGNAEINLVQFNNMRVDIKDNKLHYACDMKFAGLPKFMTIPVRIATGLKIENNKIKMTNVQVLSDGVPSVQLDKILSMINFALFDLKEIEKNGVNIDITKLELKDNKLETEGTIWVPANYKG